MQHIITPYAKPFCPFATWVEAFSEKELDTLQEKARLDGTPGIVGSNDNFVINKSIRKSNVSWMHKNENSAWVFERLSHVVSSLNCRFYNFNLTEFGEALQLTNYDSADAGFYGWHMDMGGVYSRKLSLVLQLSNPEDYNGGELQLNSGKSELEVVLKQRGLITVFPSFLLHQVTPVTHGTRQTLVCWVTGPQFS